MWLQAGEERRDRVDVGLCVKNGGKGLFVPDFARPIMESGDAKGEGRRAGGLVALLRPARFACVFVWLYCFFAACGVKVARAVHVQPRGAPPLSLDLGMLLLEPKRPPRP